MSHDRPRPSRAMRRALLQVEGLDDRVLMSGIATTSSPSAALPIQSVTINTPSKFVSQQASGLDVSLVRSASEPKEQHVWVASAKKWANFSALVNVPLTDPLTVNFAASVGSTGVEGQNLSLPSSASDTFTPVNMSITFPAGVSTETVRIPINSGAANPGSVPIELAVTSSSPGVDTSQSVYLVTGPAALPATPTAITSAHLVFQRKSASGIAITFSQPVSPASVENLHNYAVTTKTPENSVANAISGLLSIGESNGPFYSIRPVPLKAAQYNPTTSTVMLIPKKPLKISADYEIQNATPLAQHTLIDLHGNAVEGNGAPEGTFSFSLRGAKTLNWAAPQPATIFSGS
jgi:hypothetical protein